MEGSIDVPKIWALVGFMTNRLEREQMITSFVSRPIGGNESKFGPKLVAFMQGLRLIEDKTYGRWRQKLKLYDAYVSGLLLMTSLLYETDDAKLVSLQDQYSKSLKDLINANSNVALKRITHDQTAGLVGLEWALTKRFMELAGWKMVDDLSVCAKWILSHSSMFKTTIDIERSFDAVIPIQPVTKLSKRTGLRLVDEITSVIPSPDKVDQLVKSNNYEPYIILSGPTNEDLALVSYNVAKENPLLTIAHDGKG